MNCCHGVSYAVKALLKHESPTDYVDLLRPLENLPYVLVCDMPDRVAKQLYKAAPDLLKPK